MTADLMTSSMNGLRWSGTVGGNLTSSLPAHYAVVSLLSDEETEARAGWAISRVLQLPAICTWARQPCLSPCAGLPFPGCAVCGETHRVAGEPVHPCLLLPGNCFWLLFAPKFLRCHPANTHNLPVSCYVIC